MTAQPMTVHSQLKTVTITMKKLREKISDLYTEAATGSDGIRPMFLKELKNGLAPALAMIFT